MGENQEFRLFYENIRKSVYIYEPCTVMQSQDTRYFEIFCSYYYTQSSLTSRIFRNSNYQNGTTNLEITLGEIICKMLQNGKIDGKFKIMNPIYDDKNFAEDPLEIHPKMTIIAKPIRVLSMNILTLMIQIKLHLMVKLL